MKAATSRIASSPQFHFIGGKGGVGKTTCAAAFALEAASAGTRVLVISTDPAPSLGDALKARLTRCPRLLRPRLHAVEIDAAAVLRRWTAERRRTLENIALQGTWLDRDDVTKLLNLSLPGIDEVTALLEILRFSRTRHYDRLIVDTAPTGHTIRMLDMPETLLGIARVFDRMREKHRTIVEALRGGWTADAEDRLIDNLAREARDMRGILTDRTRARVSWVTLPEPMAIAETADALAQLEARGIGVDDVIVNRLTPQGKKCAHCDARRAFEAVAIRELTARRQIFITAREREPRGITALAAMGRELRIADAGLKPWATTDGLKARSLVVQPFRAAASRRKRGTLIVRPFRAASRGQPVPIEDVVTEGTRLVMFGGKGGVGKTTCAAAAAVAAATRWPQRAVRLVSTDPAHSLSDALGKRVTDQQSAVPGAPPNLLARELDSAQVLERVREQYAWAIDGMFDRIRAGGSFDLTHDRSVMQALMDLAPPGLDELAAIVEITQDASSDGTGITVIDTAPTGHALRLLEMPALIHDWTKALMAILLKYQHVAGLGELGTLLLNLSRGLGRLRELLTDRVRTRFIVVTRPAAVPSAETVRLLRRLRRLDVQVPLVVINAVGRGRCVRCAKATKVERQEIRAFARTSDVSRRIMPLAIAGTSVPPPQSPTTLLAWQQAGWRYHQDA